MLSISSINRETVSDSLGNFRVILNENIRYNSIHLAGASISYSWPLFNDSFYFNEGGSTLSFALSSGVYYTTTELATDLKTGLDAEGAEVYTVSISDNTGLITISATGAFEIEHSSFTVRDRAILGFDVSDTGSDTSHVSEYVVNLSPDSIIFIESNLNDNIHSHGVIAKYFPITNNNSPFEMITVGNMLTSANPHTIISRRGLANFSEGMVSIKLRDAYGNILTPQSNSHFVFTWI